MRLFRPMQTSLCPGSFVSNFDLALVCECVLDKCGNTWYQTKVNHLPSSKKDEREVQISCRVQDAHLLQLNGSRSSSFWQVWSRKPPGPCFVSRSSRLPSSRSHWNHHLVSSENNFYFRLATCSRLMDTPTSLRIPYILLHVMIDCCREKHFNIWSEIFCGKTFHAN